MNYRAWRAAQSGLFAACVTTAFLALAVAAIPAAAANSWLAWFPIGVGVGWGASGYMEPENMEYLEYE